jgi:5-formyltetrahydrofolate cyclo-ligase
MLPDAASPDIVLTGPALHQAKRALRAQMIGARDAIDPALRAKASRTIAARLQELPSFAGARTVLLTLPFRSEWDTLPLVLHALAAGRTVAVPRVNAITRMLELFAIADPACDAGVGLQGIPEPLPHCRELDPVAVDWVLVPGVAFDREGRRLGYGGGYYDRLLPLLSRDATRIAGAFDLQIVDRVPAGPHDVTLDAIVTPSEMIVPPPRNAT